MFGSVTGLDNLVSTPRLVFFNQKYVQILNKTVKESREVVIFTGRIVIIMGLIPNLLNFPLPKLKVELSTYSHNKNVTTITDSCCFFNNVIKGDYYSITVLFLLFRCPVRKCDSNR